ncbi:MAG: hypothetical protein NC410_11815, partial [Oscillibacter sp.]|nr:hypothetical protein [Oscillibacter sp.]
MKTIRCFLLVAFLALWGCQQEQLSQEENQFDVSHPYPRMERLRTIKRVDNTPATRAVGVKDKLWHPGDTIRIKFQNADEYPDMPEKVIRYAAIWLEHANLHFEYVEPHEEADVKIGFRIDSRGLSWSTIGTDCRAIAQNDVSANIVWLDDDDEETIQGEVLRTFGHILGLGFEHQSPDSPITLNDIKTIDYYSDYYDLSEEDVINDILPYYNADQTNYTEFDDESIMCLDLPGRKTQKSPFYNLDFNYTLSSTDIAFVRDSLYPTPETVHPTPGTTADCLMEISVYGISMGISCQRNDTLIVVYSDGYIDTIGPKDSFSHRFRTMETHSAKIYGSDIAIEKLYLNAQNITSLVINENKALKLLWCSDNRLETLDISQCPALEELECSRNHLTKVNLPSNSRLKVFLGINNQLASIDISEQKNLWYFACDSNFLTQLDVSQNKELSSLQFRCNQITSIDLKNN